MFDIQRGSRAVLLANRVYSGGITVRLRIFCSHLAAKGALAEWIVENGVRSAGKILLGEGGFLGQKDPWPVCHCELCIGMAPSLGNRNDIEHGQPLHFVRMVESEAIGHPPAAVGSDQIEFRESEF